MSGGGNGGRPARLTRVVLRNYRSIPACDVRLGALTFLVGPNGSGKSNFLDALRLVSDSLNTSLDHALRDRGGVSEVRRRSSGHPTNFGLRVEFVLPENIPGHFAFEVGARSGGTYVVQTEQCHAGSARYRVTEGRIEVPPGPVSPPASDDRLYLVNAAGLPAYLSKIVPGIEGVEQKSFGHMETLEFRQRVQGAEHPWRFNAISMSDGTLRALGMLVALFQAKIDPNIPVIGIEEPEVALHPAAAGLLRDALREGARAVQVIVTSHSPDLLDDREISDSQICAVANRDGATHIAPLDEATRSALRDRLYTAGEMLRANQLEPDLSAVPEPAQLGLFEVGA